MTDYERLLELDPARSDPTLAKARASAWMAFCKGLATMGNRDAGEHKHTFQSWRPRRAQHDRQCDRAR